jgi:ATP-dependent DNA helicase RecQ
VAQIKWTKAVDLDECEHHPAPSVQFLGWLYRHKPPQNPWIFDPKNLATKARLSQKTLHHFLESLHRSNDLFYQIQIEDTEIEYLMPREDDRTIEAFLPSLKPLMESKEKKQNQIFQYLDLVQGCRMSFILSYFGEQTDHVCGICDLCHTLPDPDPLQSQEVRAAIIRCLQENPSNSRTLVDMIKAPEAWILHSIAALLSEELIEINRENDYAIKR